MNTDAVQKTRVFDNGHRPNGFPARHSNGDDARSFSGHIVQFYEEDENLIDSVAAFIGAGLGSGEAAIVIATPAHRQSLSKKLASHGINLATVEQRGQFIALDASATLSKFMVDGLPDEERFKSVVGGVVEHSFKGRHGLRAFGEMVALLWADGNGEASIRLEELWNALAESHSFSLFCAYPVNGFADAKFSREFDRICKEHSCVLPSQKYTFHSEGDSLREIATLQQRALALKAEIVRRKQTEEALRDSEAKLNAELADSNLLRAISAEIVFEPSLEALYEKLVDAATAIMRSDFASMQMFYPERGELRLLAHRGLGPQMAKTFEWVGRKTESSCGLALRRNSRVVLPDLEHCDSLNSEGRAVFCGAGIAASHSTPLFSRNGQLVGMISTHWKTPHQPQERELRLFDILARLAADVIERKRAEMLLRESEERYRKLVSLMPAGVYSCNAEGRITFYNDRAAELWGRKPAPDDSERFCACYKAFLADGTYVPPHQTPMAIAVREGKTFRNVEATVERPDGSRFVACINIDPLRDEQGNILGAINVFQDITDRKQAEESLRKRSARLELLSDALAQLLSARDPDTVVRELFAKVAKELGVDAYFNYMVSEGESALRLHSYAGIPDERARDIERLELGQSICGTVAQTREAIHATDIQNSSYDEAALVRGLGIQCYVCNPLVVEDRLLGTLSFASRTRRAFDEDELQFLRIISQYTAVALERLRTAQALRQSEKRLAQDARALTRLNDVGSGLWQTSSFKQGIEKMLDATIEMLDADMGNIQLLEGDSLRIEAQRGFEKDFLEFFQTVSVQDESACGRALRYSGCRD